MKNWEIEALKAESILSTFSNNELYRLKKGVSYGEEFQITASRGKEEDEEHVWWQNILTVIKSKLCKYEAGILVTIEILDSHFEEICNQVFNLLGETVKEVAIIIAKILKVGTELGLPLLCKSLRKYEK